MKRLINFVLCLCLLGLAPGYAENEECEIYPESHVLVPSEDYLMMLDLYGSCLEMELLPEDSPGMPGFLEPDGCEVPKGVVGMDKDELYNLLYDINYCLGVLGGLEAWEVPPCKDPTTFPWARGCGRYV